MKTMIRLFLVAALLAVSAPHAVQAAGPAGGTAARLARPALDSTTCRAFPSQATCDLQDVGVCESDAITLVSATAGGFFPVRGVVRYSPSCQSAWARGVNINGLPYNVGAQILRSDGSFSKTIGFFPTTEIRSKMLFLGPQGGFQFCARAIGSLELNNGVIINSATTSCAFP